MASFRGISATAESVVRLLRAEFQVQQPLGSNAPTRVELIRTNDLALVQDQTLINPPAVSLLVYRVDFDKVTRPAWAATGFAEGRSYLPLDVHFLLAAWAENAEHELQIIGRALQAIDTRPILSGPLLHPDGAWAENETVEIVLEDIPTDDLMRIYDSLNIDYRLSVPLLARVVVVVGLQEVGGGDVQTVVQGIRPFEHSS